MKDASFVFSVVITTIRQNGGDRELKMIVVLNERMWQFCFDIDCGVRHYHRLPIVNEYLVSRILSIKGYFNSSNAAFDGVEL